MATYTTAVPFMGPLPTWLNADDASRLTAYSYYEALLRNQDDAFKITLRDDEENPIYIPTARRIIKTLCRYTAKDLTLTTIPASPLAPTPEQLADTLQLYSDLFDREQFFSRFYSAMFYGMAWGDWAMFVYADPLKPEGSRISIKAVDPGMVFPIFDPNDVDRVIGVSLIEQFTDTDNKLKLKRQRWLTARAEGHPQYADGAYVLDAPITYDSIVLEIQDWENEKKRKVVRTETPIAPIPGITSLPVYRFKNDSKPGEQYGVSELAGLERLFLAVNQAVTDEDVALAMNGLGVYVTDQKPIDENGNEVDWVVGPRRVIEVKPAQGKGAKDAFTRVDGVTSITASQEHYKWLQEMAESTAGISDVALGQVDTAVATSGIALALRMGPILDTAATKDKLIEPVLNQLLYDLRSWFQVYESLTVPDSVITKVKFGEKLPVDKDKLVELYQDLYVNGVLPLRTYIKKLNELGFDLGDPEQVVKDLQAEAAERQANLPEDLGGDIGTGSDRLDNPDGEDPTAADDPTAAE